MKFNPFLVVVGAAVLFLLACAAARAADETTTLAWDPNDPADRISSYVVQFRPRTSATNSVVWSEIVVPAAPAPSVVLPISPFGAEFRLAARNSLGSSPWTDIVFLPAAVRGLKLVLPLVP